MAWNFVGAVSNQGSTFVANLILANVLGLQVFGEYATVQSTLVVFSVLGQLAMGYTATKYVAEFRTSEPARAGRLIGLLGGASLLTGLLAAVVLALFAPRIAVDVLRAPAVATPLMLASGALFFAIVNGFLMGTLAGLESYAALGRVNLLSGIVYLGAALAGGMVADVPGVLLGIALSGFLQAILLATAVFRESRRQRLRLHFGLSTNEVDVLLRFALPAALNGFISVPAIWFGSAHLVRQADGLASMALFTAANSFRIVVLFLPNTVNNVTMAFLNHRKGARDRLGYRRIFWMNLLAILASVVIGAVVVAATGQWLLILFGAEFTAAYPVLLVLMLVTIPESVSLALLQIIQSHERIWFTFWGMTVPSYLVLVLAAYWLVPPLGAVGLSWAYLAQWIVALGACGVMAGRLGVEPVLSPRPEAAESRN